MDVDIMAIGAHPDDVDIGMAGTILAFKEAAYRVVIVDLSDGEPTPMGSHDIRMKESQAAANLMGVDRRITLDMTNREIMDTIENRKKLASVIREYKPKIIFAPYGEDGHPDHVQASRLVLSARFYAKFVKTDMPHSPHYPAKIYQFFTNHLRLKIQPAFVYDITRFMDMKQLVMACFESQFVLPKRDRNVFDFIRSENAYWGSQINTQFGEPFMCLENIAIKTPEALLNA